MADPELPWMALLRPPGVHPLRTATRASRKQQRIQAAFRRERFFNMGAKNCPVKEPVVLATSSGVPVAMI